MQYRQRIGAGVAAVNHDGKRKFIGYAELFDEKRALQFFRRMIGKMIIQPDFADPNTFFILCDLFDFFQIADGGSLVVFVNFQLFRLK